MNPERPDVRTSPSPEPIAIIGIGCRFPGARGPAALWDLLARGVDAISDVPPSRFDVAAFYDPRPRVPGKVNTRWGGFLDDVDRFDPFFFGIAPREATGMDPQQRIFLEVAWEAIEDAGLVPAELAGRGVGVFAGVCTSDYEGLIETPAMDIYTTTGSARAVLPGRVSYALGLEGPCVAIDTACSSSLVAVHLACQSLWSGESAIALAGGVNLVLGPDTSVGFAQAQMLASDGRCKAFDARGDGFVRSEGAGVVVLKPLGRALADGDPIHALIRATAVNNDGRSGGLMMTPSRPGQEAVLRQAYRLAGVRPSEVQYVEAHGTGTLAGDPVEAQALGAVLGAGRPADRPCVIGSIKTNIGHTEAAAGVAGLIKAALCLEHRAIPGSLHFHEPNPRIPWGELPLKVQPALGSWPAHEGPARAGVSSFGISGTNAHAVLEEAPALPPAPAVSDPGAHVLALSAHRPEALRDLAAAYQAMLASVSAGAGAPALGDVCYTAAVRRGHHDHRLAVVARTREEIAERLEAFGRGEARPGLSAGRRRADRAPRRVFVFPGQGSQWTGMARDLLEREPVFREAIERCGRAMRAHVPWSLVDELTADDAAARFESLDVIQPVLFALQVALATLWRAWGIEPDAVVGHSMGEMAAAHVAGILDLDDAVRVVCRRGRVLQARAQGRGGMAVLEQPAEEVARLLEGYGDRLSVAAFNGPTTTVVSGEVAALQELRDAARRRGLFCSMVKIEYAPHSPLTEPFLDEVRAELQGLRPRRAEVPMRSTVTGALLDGGACGPEYWVRNLREPVRFAQALEGLVDEGHDVFVEISAHPLMTAAITQCLRGRGVEGEVVASMRRGEDGAVSMRGALGALYAGGQDLPWRRLYPAGRVVSLPAYPWQRERFWKPDAEGGVRAARGEGGGRGPAARGLLGPHMNSAAHPDSHLWQRDIGAGAVPYLADHRVQGAIVLPAAVYLEMALSAAPRALGEGPVALERVSFRKALFLSEDAAHTVQLAVTASGSAERAFEFYSRPAAGPAAPSGSAGAWTLHVSGAMRLGPAADGSPPEPVALDPIRTRCAEVLETEAFYALMRARGLEYGASFQGVERAYRRHGEALGRLRLAAPVESTAGHYRVHPALLDACFQVMASAFSVSAVGDTFLPVGLDRLRVEGAVPTSGWAHAVLRPAADAAADTREGDIVFADDEGRVVVEVRGFRFQRLERGRAEDGALADWLHEPRWEPRPAAAPARTASPGAWIVFVDARGVGRTLAEGLAARGERCLIVSRGGEYGVAGGHVELDPARPEHFRRLLDEAAGPGALPWRGIVHLWSLDAPSAGELDASALEDAQRLTCASSLHLVQALATRGGAPPRLWLVTAGAQAAAPGDVPAVAQAPAWGLGRVIALEHPELRCASVDLATEPSSEEVQALLAELSVEDGEAEIALRGAVRLVARLAPSAPRYREDRRLATSEDAYRLDVPTPGILDGFALRTAARRPPGPGEVEIRVAAVGLNFRDVLIAMGLVPAVVPGARAFGFECAGAVIGVGPGVDGVAVGDSVIAAAPGCFGSHATVPAALVVPRPAHLSVEEAATIPIAFLTAYYALHHLGRLRRGERVLIHAAAGGVGQAAMQIARWTGARIYATAGNPEKRELLRRQGAEHVMDSRSLDFAAEVRRVTGGEGVDVVLNSLAGEFIARGLSTLAPGGRFLEIGKVDVLQNSQLGLRQMQDNVSFSVIDLGQMLSASPARAGDIFRDMMRLFADGTLTPLPLTVFPVAEAAEAFRHMAQARHIGKIVVSLDGPATVVASSEVEALPAEATYLITGGLGGLGLAAAQHLVDMGARHLVLLGRSGAPDGAAAAALDALRARAEVRAVAADVSDERRLAEVLDEVAAAMPPLRGVIHAAGVLDDGILLQQDATRFRAVLAPKVVGAWNLHALTRKAPLDFFVLFSSAVSLLGSPGQGSYVAANAFLDALAHFRRAQGLPALAINWGAWAEVGMAARPERMRHLAALGIVPFAPAQGVEILGRLLGHDGAQMMAVAVDRQRLGASGSALAARLLGGAPGAESESGGRARPARDEVLAAAPADRPRVLAGLLLDQMAVVLRCAPSQIDPHQPLSKLGIDSLMAVELKNRIESDLGVSLPVVALLEGPTLSQLAGRVVGLLGGPAPPAADLAMAREDTPARVLARLDQLSDSEVEAMLRHAGAELTAGPPAVEGRGLADGSGRARTPAGPGSPGCP